MLKEREDSAKNNSCHFLKTHCTLGTVHMLPQSSLTKHISRWYYCNFIEKETDLGIVLSNLLQDTYLYTLWWNHHADLSLNNSRTNFPTPFLPSTCGLSCPAGDEQSQWENSADYSFANEPRANPVLSVRAASLESPHHRVHIRDLSPSTDFLHGFKSTLHMGDSSHKVWNAC